MLGQPLSMLLPEVVGFKLKGQLKEGVTATDLVLTVTQMLRKQGVVGKFVEFFGPGLDHLSVADKATIGNMAPEYGATCGFFPVDAATIDYLKTSGRKADARRAGDRLRQGAGPVPHRQVARSGIHGNADARSRRRGAVDGRTEAPRRPRRAAGGRGRFCHRDGQRIQEGRRWLAALSGREPQFRSRPWRRGDRGDHLLHQHLQSERADRRRPAGAQRRRQGPEGKALGQDLAGAGQPGGRGISRQFRPADRSRQGRLQPGRLRLHHLHRQFRSAAGRDFEVDQRQRHRRRRRAVGQPQLRRPRQPGRAGELSGLAAAGRGLCAGGNGDQESRGRADRQRQGRQAGVSEGHLADDEGDQRFHEEVRDRDDLQEEVRRRVQGRHQLAQDQDRRERDLSLEHELDLCAEPALLRRHEEGAGADRRCRRCAHSGDVRRQDHHRPHLAGRLDQADLARRQISSASIRCVRPTSISTARGAAITKS